MDGLTASVVTVGLIVLFLGMGTWIFVGLMLVGVTSLFLILDFPIDRIGFILKGIMWKTASTWELAAIPIFILMGEIIYRTDMSDRVFRGLAPFVNWLPGRLLHTNIVGCTLFAAMSGSSTATTATIGRITTKALAERNYNEALTIGSLAGAGSLGLLIPPSIVMIIYGVLAEVSIVRLFAAGILPGLMVAGLYSAYIILSCSADPEKSPQAIDRFTWKDRFWAALDLFPVFLLIVVVLGGIYTGFATPSEAAALGFAASLLLALVTRQLTVNILIESLMSALNISCMAITIVVSASFLSTAMGFIHVPQMLASEIASLGLSPYGLIFVLSMFYILLGLFLDGISIVVMSLPITLPIAMLAGWDPIWFGVFLVIMVELGQITPPIGFNLFVLQGITNKPIGKIALYALPFFLLMCLAVVILTLFPEIALWLPKWLLD
ncbi:TRAP transporter large permease [Sneathiella litorea]|uniref:TRAP transporter large permease protein n=1 Tax=Sneathiella litorea TaxID=2606216 RepID=A0A6L8WAK8_9PROT|nr:TRAP transporter large permease subunit [Sneathiella litorea]MZR31480.1 TRAP transporter large permease subunit [Sneathiella litorea]